MKRMKKLTAILLALCMLFALAACGGGETNETDPPVNDTPSGGGEQTQQPSGGEENPGGDVEPAKEITLWTYPIGNWGQESVVNELTAAFEAETGIKVNVEYLDYTNGDDSVNSAIVGGNTPDLIMEGAERLVANWGVNGHMVDLSDMLDDEDRAELNPAVLGPCTAPDGSVYEYPLVMTAHCMAINVKAFEEAGALQYVDLESHTWTTENFFKAVQALYDHYGSTVGAVFCQGQGGDQGTRALVSNLYGAGSLVTDKLDGYTWDRPEVIQALQALYDQDGIAFDASIAGGQEIALFYQGVLKMAFCWNIQQQVNPNAAGTGSGLTMSGDEIAIMAFPSENGTLVLEGGNYGFGIFNNGDESKIAAAKMFIKYMCDSEHTVDAVKAANFFPARTAAEGTDLSTVWDGNDIMSEYTKLMPYLGPYVQVTKGWAQARTSWWNMLQKVGEGADIATTVAAAAAEANAAAAG